MIRCGKDGKPEYVDRAPGAAKTGTGWPVTPEALYYGIRFLTGVTICRFILQKTECPILTIFPRTDRCMTSERITFLDAYLGAVQRAVNEECR